ncbi:hypothetical protein [Nonomuraea sediminis]|uniref:hypothetical protein n=1 Tax=Nonomuraea sediminis TaxID=2835864 RepID=UPI001BDCE7E1|nr:hypothetical protein [Nonomuraea sediminis]
MLTRRRALITLTGSVFLLGGCRLPGRLTGVEKTRDATDMQADVKRFIDRRNAALRSGDEQAWLAGVDTSNAALVAAQKLQFENLRKFQWETLQLSSGPSDGPLVAKPQRHAKTLPQDADGFKVRLVSKLAGVDRDGSASDFIYLFAMLNGQYTMIDVGPVTDDYGLTYDSPWELTRLTVVKKGDVVLATDGSVPDFDAYAKVAARASAEVRRDWLGNPAPAGFALFLTGRPASYKKWFGAGTPNWSEGVEIPLLGANADKVNVTGHYAGSRIVVNMKSALKSDNPLLVMKHEITHAISAAVQEVDIELGPVNGDKSKSLSLSAPRWAVEGFARYIENRGTPAASDRWVIRDGLAKGLLRADLPNNEHFYDDKYRSFNYSLGWSLFQFIAEAKGHATAVKVYVGLVTRPSFGNMQGSDALFDTLYRLKLQREPFVSTSGSLFWQQWTAFLRRM